MTRSWTRIHAHLGAAAGPLTFEMVRQAAADHLEESDDLDWKQALPAPPRDGRWNEFAKDVAAMANTRGGLLIFGVVDKTTELIGIDPGRVNVQQYAQWVRNHVEPYLPSVTGRAHAAAPRAVVAPHPFGDAVRTGRRRFRFSPCDRHDAVRGCTSR